VVFGDPTSYVGSLSQAAVDDAITNMRAMLQPLLDQYDANVDPLVSSYVADHRKLDAVFDLVTIEISSGTVTVTDKTTGNIIAQAATNDLAHPSRKVQSADVPSQQVIDDIDGINAKLSELITVLNKSDKTATDLDPFFADNYGTNDGLNRTEAMDYLLGWNFPVSISKANLTLVMKYNGGYIITALLRLSDSSLYGPYVLIFVSENGTWKLKGNGYKSAIYLFSGCTTKWIKTDASEEMESGIILGLGDPGNKGLQKAVVAGPGLPSGGISLSKPAGGGTVLSLDNVYRSALPTDAGNLYVLNDARISEISGNASYTVNFYATDNTSQAPVETRTVSLPKGPFTRAEVTLGYFPTFTGIASHDIAAAQIGGTLSFGYAAPGKVSSALMLAELNYWDDANQANVSVALSPERRSASISSSAPETWAPTQACFQMENFDTFRRQTKVVWLFD
ncbi:MAG: hypothetical protein PHY31_06700, partial [Smithellaceae bacterium]|nr:hypothetical protein [Smithellaceae bacterium]